MAGVSLDEIIRRALDDRLADVHTSTLARVEKFDSASWTADVKPLTRRAVPSTDGGYLYEDQPVIPGAIVLCLGTPRSFLKAPLQAGDFVWLVFAETSLDEALETSSVSDPGYVARHSMATPLAIPVCLPGKATGGGALASLASVQSAVNAVQSKFDSHIHSVTAPPGIAGGPCAVLAPASPVGTQTVAGTAEVVAK